MGQLGQLENLPLLGYEHEETWRDVAGRLRYSTPGERDALFVCEWSGRLHRSYLILFPHIHPPLNGEPGSVGFIWVDQQAAGELARRTKAAAGEGGSDVPSLLIDHALGMLLGILRQRWLPRLLGGLF